MQTKSSTQMDYTTRGDVYQFFLPLNIECKIPKDDPVRLVRSIIEGMDLDKLYHTYSRKENSGVTPRQMLAILVYANMNGIFSSRKIETACRRDINFMYLLEGKHVPSYSTIARFRSLHLSECIKDIFAQMIKALWDMGAISGEHLFVDGTKIEASANKYTFVWKKTATKNQQKLLDTIPEFVCHVEEIFGIQLMHQKDIHVYHLKRLRKKLKQIQHEEQIVFIHEKGKVRPLLQRFVEELDRYIKKLKEYAYKIHRCGKRSSYSKTDEDATFMRMKDDHLKRAQLKPAYNVQYGVDSEYIVWASVGPRPADITTLIPLLKELNTYIHHTYPNVIADAGYESEENYVWLKKQGQKAYIKPCNYETRKTRKHKKDIGHFENMEYDEETDTYLCINGKRLSVVGIKKVKTETGYITTKTQYRSQDCRGCAHKAECMHGKSVLPLEERTKGIEVSKVFQKERGESLKRITTSEGIKLRVNRSIQAEGAFSEVKENMNFRRFLSRGRVNVLVESMLVAMAHNVNKLHHKLQSGRQEMHLYPVKTAV